MGARTLSSEASADPWDDYAPTYRRQLWLERTALDRLAGLLDVAPTERVLDVGTGTGAMLAVLARQSRRPAEAVGIDRSTEMLARAGRLPPGWHVERADASALPFEDSSFDVVTAAYLLHVLEPVARSRTLAEVVRVLRPGGRVGTVTIGPPRSAVGRVLTAPLRHASERSEGRLAGMRPLDPEAELVSAGLDPTGRTRSWLGYPSLCVVADRRHG